MCHKMSAPGPKLKVGGEIAGEALEVNITLMTEQRRPDTLLLKVSDRGVCNDKRND